MGKKKDTLLGAKAFRPNWTDGNKKKKKNSEKQQKIQEGIKRRQMRERMEKRTPDDISREISDLQKQNAKKGRGLNPRQKERLKSLKQFYSKMNKHSYTDQSALNGEEQEKYQNPMMTWQQMGELYSLKHGQNNIEVERKNLESYGSEYILPITQLHNPAALPRFAPPPPPLPTIPVYQEQQQRISQAKGNLNELIDQTQKNEISSRLQVHPRNPRQNEETAISSKKMRNKGKSIIESDPFLVNNFNQNRGNKAKQSEDQSVLEPITATAEEQQHEQQENQPSPIQKEISESQKEEQSEDELIPAALRNKMKVQSKIHLKLNCKEENIHSQNYKEQPHEQLKVQDDKNDQQNSDYGENNLFFNPNDLQISDEEQEGQDKIQQLSLKSSQKKEEGELSGIDKFLRQFNKLNQS